jgi:uncharacterized protein YecE (DUF72 family)
VPHRPAAIHIGTSGWSYAEWKGSLYAAVPQRRWLERYAQAFGAVEANGTFYRLPAPHVLEGWHRRTPSSFVFTIKGHRALTHLQRLQGAAEVVARCRENAAPLREKLAAVLWQLPNSLPLSLPRLRELLDALDGWPESRHAFEPRHASWYRDDVAEELRAHRVAVCISDAPAWPAWDAVTTDLVYVRLHGHERLYASSYPASAIERWAERARTWRDEGRQVHVYFDNTSDGSAITDALALRRALGEIAAMPAPEPRQLEL